MRIGLDIDGVIVNSEEYFRVCEEICAIEDLHKKIKNRTEPKFEARYNATEEDRKVYYPKYFLKSAKKATILPGFLEIFEKLKKLGHKFIIITARGSDDIDEGMVENALELFEKYNLKFNGVHFAVKDKLEICKKENIDVMIDDDYRVIKKVASGKVKGLYFRYARLKKLRESKYVHEVNNWGDIYRYFYEQKERDE